MFIFSAMMLCSAGVTSCSDAPGPVQTTDHLRMLDDSLLNFNHEVVVAESQEIDDFISRYHWNMNKSQTGLRWMVYKKGRGPVVRQGDIALIKYSVSRINGDLLYRSDLLKPFEFETGKAKVPNGLEEGVLVMKPGDRAKLIVPSHLAFGLLGDMDKIKSRQTLVYDVELCDVKPRKN
jgi:FKBP-type peptidyl-prolyl cis-trans isomerase